MTYDVIIIGAGPAGLTAGLYAARAKMKTLIIEREKVGGQITGTNEVANYPGAAEGITGPELTDRMAEQCAAFGAEMIKETVKTMTLTGDVKHIVTNKGAYASKSVILAMGASPRKLGVEKEIDLTGRGVSYCATCDADFFTDLEVVVVGGGDTALEEAIFLTKFAKHVSVIHRRDQFRAAKSIVEKAEQNEKISFVLDSGVKSIIGDELVQGVVVENFKTKAISEIKADDADGFMGLFIFVGYLPDSELIKDVVTCDEAGYIVADELMKTNIPGVFAAGDLRAKSLRQVVTATADGAIAAVQAEKYVDALEN
ncbi:thioredoxin-disulfide reductase [Fusibacter paucivorans]|uniref:Thioredoxin reductase n=1 Tax=Fusibacter paucivorans TaxID=76009 RepID=A0ABS5PMK9_9FIRM|nr:thioredoxin-disulfide reductase [Fusibacter paucivorans]MBS7526400.1 thioredoxin-disulfide reductase [Fusibacter paucivorans]